MLYNKLKVFALFDIAASTVGVYKIHTIGDCYVATTDVSNRETPALTMLLYGTQHARTQKKTPNTRCKFLEKIKSINVSVSKI